MTTNSPIIKKVSNKTEPQEKIKSIHLINKITCKQVKNSNQTKKFPKHIKSQKYLNIYNPHKYAFNQYNEKMYIKLF